MNDNNWDTSIECN